MADLPDLDPEQVSWVAWWNLMDHADPAPDSINPEDTLSASSFEETEYYDNGIIAEYNTTLGQDIYIRVKSDGWFVAYMDRSENYVNAASDEDLVYGEYMITGEPRDSLDLTHNILSDAINMMASELSVWSDVLWEFDGVGLYNYSHEGSQAVYMNTYMEAQTGIGTKTQTQDLYYNNTTPAYLSFVVYISGDETQNYKGSFSDEITGVSGTSIPAEYYSEDALKFDPVEEQTYTVTTEQINGPYGTDVAFTYIGVY